MLRAKKLKNPAATYNNNNNDYDNNDNNDINLKLCRYTDTVLVRTHKTA